VLTYWDARLTDGSITYMGQNQTKGRTVNNWCRLETWGGKLVENIVQAFARDCLAEAMVRLDDAGFATVFHVHDEIVAEEPIDGRGYKDMAAIMGRPIEWAPGLLLSAEGYATPFYMKD
jgi:DNA polymerase